MRASDYKLRQAGPEDGSVLCEILNEIIMIGGTTALETLMTVPELVEHYINGPDCLSCVIAEVCDGMPQGFQLLVKSAELPADWADIGTFTRKEARGTGIGAALFAGTTAVARDQGIPTINATIRADNTGGLRYYEKMGFVSYKVATAVPLEDGTLVDRIYKRYSPETK